MKLVISGTTGVGKSTTVNLLKKSFERRGKKVKVIGELVSGSPYFDLYFNNLSEWGFIAQMDFLLERFRQFMEAEKLIEQDPNLIIIYDRHFIEDKIFADLYWVKQNISAFQSSEYLMVWKDLLKKINDFEPLDFFVLLKADFDTVRERMKKRGRSQEEKFHIKYWKDLYWKYYNTYEYRRLFKDSTSKFVELVTDEKTPDQVVDSILKYVNKRSTK